MTPRMLDGLARVAAIVAILAALVWLAGLIGLMAVGNDPLPVAIILGLVAFVARRQARRGRASDRDFTA